MVLDQGLSNQAKAYAQKIANMGQLMHSSQPERDDATENLAYACSSKLMGFHSQEKQQQRCGTFRIANCTSSHK